MEERANRCDRKVVLGRRQFLSGAGIGAAAAATVAIAPERAKASPQLARVSYPSNRLANVADLKLNQPLQVAYPDASAPGVLLKLGTKVPGGVGPDGDIVGFTTVCPHKGFPRAYNASDRTLNCPGHYSRFDCENGGQQIWCTPPRTSPNISCGSTPTATSLPMGSTSFSTAVYRTCWRAEP